MQSKNTGNTYLVRDVHIKYGKAVITILNKKYEVAPYYFDQLQIREGDVISESLLNEIIKASESCKYDLLASTLLSKDGYTSDELKKKLMNKGASLFETRKILNKYQKLNLLNDESYALNYVKNIGPYKLIGQFKIIDNLKAKGIPDEILDKLEFDETDELNKALKYVEKQNEKLNKNPTSKKIEKIQIGLVSRGFSYHIAEEASKSITPNDKSIMRMQLEMELLSTYHKYSKSLMGKQLKAKVTQNLMNKGYAFKEVMNMWEEKDL